MKVPPIRNRESLPDASLAVLVFEFDSKESNIDLSFQCGGSYTEPTSYTTSSQADKSRNIGIAVSDVPDPLLKYRFAARHQHQVISLGKKRDQNSDILSVHPISEEKHIRFIETNKKATHKPHPCSMYSKKGRQRGESIESLRSQITNEGAGEVDDDPDNTAIAGPVRQESSSQIKVKQVEGRLPPQNHPSAREAVINKKRFSTIQKLSSKAKSGPIKRDTAYTNSPEHRGSHIAALCSGYISQEAIQHNQRMLANTLHKGTKPPQNQDKSETWPSPCLRGGGNQQSRHAAIWDHKNRHRHQHHRGHCCDRNGNRSPRPRSQIPHSDPVYIYPEPSIRPRDGPRRHQHPTLVTLTLRSEITVEWIHYAANQDKHEDNQRLVGVRKRIGRNLVAEAGSAGEKEGPLLTWPEKLEANYKKRDPDNRKAEFIVNRRAHLNYLLNLHAPNPTTPA
ncbi:uncharacterized protein Z518_10808 [Rhinocladiella mackenziei CBS 650.93]|uniref:Uncharacterized protein n=1 Tax=Rhinocladiella mackenziei CBS 650.93 TaxID=1442369 RepID=A0A0D2I9E1_9EURO|nr:uncharacterized protein Z518_10808 [Rhinocladiella mackenziei CBS 650.93]KIW99880.1 hypothetical protein Z518_10808 [Rhinocladiella mackenziei CBS 650.93]